MSLRRRRCRVCGGFLAPGRKHAHSGATATRDRERRAARLVNDGMPATEARRRAGLDPLPPYLTYRPRGRLARHLAAATGARTRTRFGRFIPTRRRRKR